MTLSACIDVDITATEIIPDLGTTGLDIPLVRGENVIRLEVQTDAGLGNVDSLTLTGGSPTTVNCADQALTVVVKSFMWRT